MSNYPEGVSDADFEGPVKEELVERVCSACYDTAMEGGSTHDGAERRARQTVEVAVFGRVAPTESWTCIYGHDHAGDYEGTL